LLDLAISPKTIEGMRSDIESFDSKSLAVSLYGPNEIWSSSEELEGYLRLWGDAFADALRGKKGVYFRIWI
jgi:hypothetical protein